MAESTLVKHLTEADFKSTVLAANQPVLVDFYATWCGPCQLAAPILEKLAEEFKGQLMVVKIDVDQNRNLASEYGVMSIPTVLMMTVKDGELKVAKEQVGFAGEAGYRAMVEEVLAK